VMRFDLRRPDPVILLLAMVAGAAACAEPADGPGRELDVVPAYRAVTLAGDTVSLSSLQGSPVLLNLWATWCPPCREEMPSLQRVHRDYEGRGLKVVGVSLDNSDAGAAIARFVEQYGIGFSILHDARGRATEVFRTFGLPETFLIAADGRLVRRWRGKVDGDSREFRKVLDEVVEKHP